jgi:hypothetical protein
MSHSYDHEEISCEVMSEATLNTRLPGEPRICCVCEGHGCIEARDAKRITPECKSCRFPLEFQIGGTSWSCKECD